MSYQGKHKNIKLEWREFAFIQTDKEWDFYSLTKEQKKFCEIIDEGDPAEGIEIGKGMFVPRSVLQACHDPIAFRVSFADFEPCESEEPKKSCSDEIKETIITETIKNYPELLNIQDRM